jgi:hypothetical protein
MLDARALKAPVEAYITENRVVDENDTVIKDGVPPGLVVEPFISCRIRGKTTEKS